MGIASLRRNRAPLALTIAAFVVAPALTETRAAAAVGIALYDHPCGSALLARSPPALADLAGTWKGMYSYANPGLRPVEFTLTLEVVGGVCRGRTEEPNTFGHPSAPMLFANVECSLTTGSVPPQIAMRKVYDGTGGQNHGVDYVGGVSADGMSITGTWTLPAGSSRFTLCKR